MTDKLPWYLKGENKRNFVKYFHESPSVNPFAKAEYAIFMASAFRKEGQVTPQEAENMALEFAQKLYGKVDLTVKPLPQKPSELINETAIYLDSKQTFLDSKSSKIARIESVLNQKVGELSAKELQLKEIEKETYTFEREMEVEDLIRKERLRKAGVELIKAKESLEKAKKFL
jgi:hypothetical protein